MMAAPVTTHSLEMKRTLPLPTERVYRAWTEAESLAQWFAPSAEYAVIVHALELRVGGSYRIEMRHSSGKSHIVLGTYRELAPPGRLAFTWRCEENLAMADTLVTVVLRPSGGGTELVLRHELFDSEPLCAEHHKGWMGCLDRIATTF